MYIYMELKILHNVHQRAVHPVFMGVQAYILYVILLHDLPPWLWPRGECLHLHSNPRWQGWQVSSLLQRTHKHDVS